MNFHGLGEPARAIGADERAYWLPASVFRETLDAVPACQARGIDLRFTFDDGNLSDYAYAFPLLAERGRAASFFVLAGRIGQPGSLSSSQIRELYTAGMTVGSHGWDHVDWRAAPPDVLDRELADSRSRIADILGHDVDSVAVPFGLFTGDTVNAARNAGYRRIFTSSGGFATADDGLVPRNTVRNGFAPARDLAEMASWKARFASALRDPLRRLKHSRR